MSDTASVLIQIKGDVADINAKLTDIKGYIGKVTDETKKMADSSKSSWALMTAGIAAAIYSLQQVIEKAQYFTNAYMEAERAQMKMAVAMRNQGDYTKEALKGMEDYAKQIQETTAFEDDYVLSMMANLKTYGMTNEEVKRATQIALDFSTAKRDEGMSVEKAGELIGKAYMGQTERLKRYGIIIDQSLPQAQKYEAVMGQLNQRFGGAAQADLETYSGRKARFYNQLKDIAEFIGQTFIKLIEALQFSLSMVSVAFWTMVESLVQGLGWLSGKLAAFADFLGLKGTADNIRGFVDHLKATEKEYAGIKNEALAMANANYIAMMSFDNVDKAVMKMKEGERTKPPKDDKLAKLQEQWASVSAKLENELDAEFLDKYEVKIGEVVAQAIKLKEQFKQIAGAQELIAQWEEAMISKERLDQRVENAKALTAEQDRQLAIIQKQYDDSTMIRRISVEKDINEAKRQRAEYVITEKQYIEAEISATQRLLEIERDRIDQGGANLKNFDEVLAKIRELENKLKDLGVKYKTTLDLPVEGWSKGWQSALEQLDSGFKQMEYLGRETATSMASTFSDFFFDVLFAKTKSFGEYLKAFLTSIGRSVSNILAQQVTGGIGNIFLGMLGGMGGGGGGGGEFAGADAAGTAGMLHAGGMVNEAKSYRLVPSYSFRGAPRYHTGIGPGETPAILQNDEGVFTKGQMAAIGRGISGQNYNVTIVAVDSQSFTELVNKNPGAIVSVIGHALKDNTALRHLMKDTVR